MLASYLLATITAFAAVITATCTPASRHADLSGILNAYGLTAPGATATAFSLLPFGSPNAPGVCATVM